MNIIRIISDGLILAGLILGASLIWEAPLQSDGNSPGLGNRALYCGIYVASLIIETLSVYFLYRFQENSDIFFWHPYLSWTIGNLVYITRKLFANNLGAVNRKTLFLERVLLWQVVVIPVLSGVTLTVGWLMKLYIR